MRFIYVEFSKTDVDSDSIAEKLYFDAYLSVMTIETLGETFIMTLDVLNIM